MKIAVDCDGTIAQWEPNDPNYEPGKIGEPITAMVERVKQWLDEGVEVVIFTARVHPDSGDDAEVARKAIQAWTLEVFGRELEVTCMKHKSIDQFWDDRAVTVELNTGRILTQRCEESKDDTDAIGAFFAE